MVFISSNITPTTPSQVQCAFPWQYRNGQAKPSSGPSPMVQRVGWNILRTRSVDEGADLSASDLKWPHACPADAANQLNCMAVQQPNWIDTQGPGLYQASQRITPHSVYGVICCRYCNPALALCAHYGGKVQVLEQCT